MHGQPFRELENGFRWSRTADGCKRVAAIALTVCHRRVSTPDQHVTVSRFLNWLASIPHPWTEWRRLVLPWVRWYNPPPDLLDESPEPLVDDPGFGSWQFLHQPAGIDSFLCKNASVVRYRIYSPSVNRLSRYINVDTQSFDKCPSSAGFQVLKNQGLLLPFCQPFPRIRRPGLLPRLFLFRKAKGDFIVESYGEAPGCLVDD
jgi:hypothetical protein